MQNLPVGNTITIDLGTTRRTVDRIDDLLPLVRDLFEQLINARRHEKDRNFALGTALLQVKAQVLHGTFTRFLEAAGFNIRTAQAAMKLAATLGDGKGGINEGKTREMAARKGVMLPDDLSTTSKRTLEIVAGMRPAIGAKAHNGAHLNAMASGPGAIGAKAHHGAHLNDSANAYDRRHLDEDLLDDDEDPDLMPEWKLAGCKSEAEFNALVAETAACGAEDAEDNTTGDGADEKPAPSPAGEALQMADVLDLGCPAVVTPPAFEPVPWKAGEQMSMASMYDAIDASRTKMRSIRDRLADVNMSLAAELEEVITDLGYLVGSS